MSSAVPEDVRPLREQVRRFIEERIYLVEPSSTNGTTYTPRRQRPGE